MWTVLNKCSANAPQHKRNGVNGENSSLTCDRLNRNCGVSLGRLHQDPPAVGCRGDSMGLLLSQTCPGSVAFTDIEELREFTNSPTEREVDGLPPIPIWLPYLWLKDNDPAPHSWDVTADSLAVLCGAALGVEWVGLAKMTSNLAPNLPFSEIPALTTTQLRTMVASAFRTAGNHRRYDLDALNL